jgi:hypothetical protein
MTVSNVSDFINDANAVTAVKSAIANDATNVAVSDVVVQFTALRRLRAFRPRKKTIFRAVRRLVSGSVRADYTITLPASLSDADKTTATNSINAWTSTSLSSGINSQMQALGLSYSAQVTSVTSPTTVAVTTEAPIDDSGTRRPSSGSFVPFLGGALLLVLGIFSWA